MLTEIHQFQQWLRRRSPHSSTHIHYVSDLKLFFNWLSKSCAQVTPQDIDAYIAHSQAQGHASATINRRLVALRTFYRFLNLTSDDAPANPVSPQRHYVRRGRRLPRDVEDADIAALFEIVTKPRDKALFLLMLRCGLRVGEARNLNLHDLYLQPQPGHLPRLWLRGKGGVERVAYLSAQALAALEEWLTVRPTVKTQAVFTNCRGRRFTVTGIQYILAQYCHHVGLWLTCHQLRHTFARHLVEAGVPVTTIQRLLGHARLRTTELYLHISDTQLQADYRAAMQQLAVRLTIKEGG